MLLLRRPTPEKIERFLTEQAEQTLTYRAVGATGDTLPTDYTIDHVRVSLGEGTAIFEAARTTLQRWQQFHVGWVQAQPEDAPIRQGQAIAIVAHLMGLWWLNACQIVYAIEEQGSPPRFGFAYGTLPDHIGSGEERFLIEMDGNGTVWYDILAFSRPQHPLARLGYPLMRLAQKRFGKQSAARMQMITKAISDGTVDAEGNVVG